jgi:flagellar basal-body rod protein FlgB
MSDHRLFDETIQVASKALDLRSRRHELIISNIANADTPGYKAFDLLVDEAMAGQTTAKTPLPMQNTHNRHLSAVHGVSAEIKPYVVKIGTQDYLRGDGNTVDMEREMTNLAANELLYKASAQIVSKKLQGLRSVIQGGKP